MEEIWRNDTGKELEGADKNEALFRSTICAEDVIGSQKFEIPLPEGSDADLQEYVFELKILHVYGVRGKGFIASASSRLCGGNGALRIGTDQATYNRALEDFLPLIHRNLKRMPHSDKCDFFLG